MKKTRKKRKMEMQTKSEPTGEGNQIVDTQSKSCNILNISVIPADSKMKGMKMGDFT
jgi:hypothetical protein